jgi:hypothetical protein
MRSMSFEIVRNEIRLVLPTTSCLEYIFFYFFNRTLQNTACQSDWPEGEYLKKDESRSNSETQVSYIASSHPRDFNYTKTLCPSLIYTPVRFN